MKQSITCKLGLQVMAKTTRVEQFLANHEDVRLVISLIQTTEFVLLTANDGEWMLRKNVIRGGSNTGTRMNAKHIDV